MAIETIFDDVIEEITVKPPIAILKELAQGLEKKTKGLLIGEVKQQSFAGTFQLGFYIVAPSLNNYTYHVFEITHDLSFYPMSISRAFDEDDAKNITSEELENSLKEIFSLPEIKAVINGLLAQIKAA